MGYHQDQPERGWSKVAAVTKNFHPRSHQQEDDGRARNPRPQPGMARAWLKALSRDRALQGKKIERERGKDDVGDHQAVVASPLPRVNRIQVDVGTALSM